jgi:carboxyl-terminal processing protease
MKDIRQFILQRITTALFVGSLMYSGNARAQQTDSSKAAIDKLAYVLQLFTTQYVDTVKSGKLAETAIKGMLADLDPHSVYISKTDITHANESLNGSFEGIGIDYQIYNDTGCIITPSPGGPSDKAGILAGDKIIKINNENATGKNATAKFISDHLRGERGTTVTVTIIRPGKDNPLEFTIPRNAIPLNSIDAVYMIEPGIGYIKLNKFANSSVMEFQEALQKLRTEDVKDLILDLRNNGGGYTNIALNLADMFLSEGKRIAYTEGLHSPRQEYIATSRGGFEKGRLIILINEFSASSSEILAGAIQDWDRGLLVGRRSFGKGLVQRPFELPDGSAVNLTIARYYTPSGRCVQKPYTNDREAYWNDASARLKNGELMYPDSIHLPDSLKYKTHGGRTVYGGGGIMPDIFVPLDTMEYVEKNRKQLQEKYPTPGSFKMKFDADKLLDDFVKYAEKRGVMENKKDLKLSGTTIKTMLQGAIARILYDSETYYEVINGIDHDLQTAISVLKNETIFEKNNINY